MQTLPVREMNRSLAQQAELVRETVEQMDGFHLGVAGASVTMMGTVVARPEVAIEIDWGEPETVIERSEVDRPAVQMEPADTVSPPVERCVDLIQDVPMEV